MNSPFTDPVNCQALPGGRDQALALGINQGFLLFLPTNLFPALTSSLHGCQAALGKRKTNAGPSAGCSQEFHSFEKGTKIKIWLNAPHPSAGWRKPPGSPQHYILPSNPKQAAEHQDFEKNAVKCEIFLCLSPNSSYRAFAVAARACKEKNWGGGRTAHAERKQIKWAQLEECFGEEDLIFLLVFFLQILSGGLGEMLGILSWCMLLLDLFSTSIGSACSSVESWQVGGRFWLFLEGLGGSGHHNCRAGPQSSSNLLFTAMTAPNPGCRGKITNLSDSIPS